jgi:hypothetical protein
VAGRATSSRPAPYWKCALAALPLLVAGAGYALFMRPDSAADAEQRRLLIELMLVERMVLATMPAALAVGWFFALTLASSELPPPSAGRRALHAMLLGAFMIYASFWMIVPYGAVSYMAFQGTLSIFVVLWLVTYSGLAWNWDSGTLWFQALVRWIVSALVFLYSLRYAGVRWDIQQWPGNASLIEAGAFHFLVLGGIELSGFHLRWIPAFARGYMSGFRKTG